MEHISDALGRVLNELQSKLNKKDNMNMKNVQGGLPPQKMKSRVLDLTGNNFLRNRGLQRDKANFVTLLLRVRADLGALGRITSDEDVQEEIETLMGFIMETVELMYSMEEYDRGGNGAA